MFKGSVFFGRKQFIMNSFIGQVHNARTKVWLHSVWQIILTNIDWMSGWDAYYLQSTQSTFSTLDIHRERSIAVKISSFMYIGLVLELLWLKISVRKSVVQKQESMQTSL